MAAISPGSPFVDHGIKHLSPSSLSLYRHNQLLWVLRYPWKVTDEATAYAWRGQAIEAAVDAILFNGVSDDDAIERAKRIFESSAQGEISPEINRERQALPDLVRQADAVCLVG